MLGAERLWPGRGPPNLCQGMGPGTQNLESSVTYPSTHPWWMGEGHGMEAAACLVWEEPTGLCTLGCQAQGAGKRGRTWVYRSESKAAAQGLPSQGCCWEGCAMLKSSWLREQMEAEVQSIYTPLARLQALAQERICPEEGIHFLILTKVPSGLEGPPRNLPQMRKDKDGLRPQFSHAWFLLALRNLIWILNWPWIQQYGCLQ